MFTWTNMPDPKTLHSPRLSRINNGTLAINVETVLRRYTYQPENNPPQLEKLYLIYRTLIAIMYAMAGSGHPGGSISVGRILISLLFGGTLKFNISDPHDMRADVIGLAAGHKAPAIYALYALMFEMMGFVFPDELPSEERRLSLYDLLGFRKNLTDPLHLDYDTKSLDGHPTPACPFVPVATGASGVGDCSLTGYAWALHDEFGANAPWTNIIEGEGGLTPGNVSEIMSAAATLGLSRIIMHVDWNNASIDSNRVCTADGKPGDYVQWDPIQLAQHHGWNVVYVRLGNNFRHILAAQQLAHAIDNGRPTVIVCRTEKGEGYGFGQMESHGAGHKFGSDGFWRALRPFEDMFKVKFPRPEGHETWDTLPKNTRDQEVVETHLLYLNIIRGVLRSLDSTLADLITQIRSASNGLDQRVSRKGCPNLDALWPRGRDRTSPLQLREWEPPYTGGKVTLRTALGEALGVLNQATKGGFIITSADLGDSTSVRLGAKPFPSESWRFPDCMDGRYIMIGGIAEASQVPFMSGVSAAGCHIGVASSYAAFIAAYGHTALRLHVIGQQAKHCSANGANPVIVVCAHAGLLTGEDGPTHADPQALQVVQANFPLGTAITLTPWDPNEVMPLLCEALLKRPAVIFPFVTRPPLPVLDWNKLSLGVTTNIGDVGCTTQGLYTLVREDPDRDLDGTILLQGPGVTHIFLTQVLPLLDGLNLRVMYVSSLELFMMLPEHTRDRILPPEISGRMMGITDHTIHTITPLIDSRPGKVHTLHAYHRGRVMGSGRPEQVMKEAGLDAETQERTIRSFVTALS